MCEAELLERLKKALRLARLDFHAVVEKARAGEVQFHEVPGAVGITALTVSGEFKTCYVVAVAGKLSAMAALESKVEAFARANGCQVIEMDGRPGWKRSHDKIADGYDLSTVKFRKLLEF